MRVKITLPDDMYADMKAKAKADFRTLSEEICCMWANAGQSGTNKEKEGGNSQSPNSKEESNTEDQGDTNTNPVLSDEADPQEVNIKVGQCGTDGDNVSPSDTQGDTKSNTEDQGDTQETTNKEESDSDTSQEEEMTPEQAAFVDSISIDFEALKEKPKPKVQPQAAEEYPPIDWDAVVKQTELASKAVKDNSGNIIGYLINGQVVKEEDLPF